MKARFIFTALPLLLSACSATQQSTSVNVTRLQAGSETRAVAINVTAPVNKVATYTSLHSTDYLKQVVIRDGKVSAQQWDQISYGTVMKGLVRKNVGDTWTASLEIKHSCRPDEKKAHFAEGVWVDTPSLTTFSSRQSVQIKRGEDLLISGKGFDTGCEFPTILLHPTE